MNHQARYARLICRHVDRPYVERRCPRCKVVFAACPVCGGVLCSACERRKNEANL